MWHDEVRAEAEAAGGPLLDYFEGLVEYYAADWRRERTREDDQLYEEWMNRMDVPWKAMDEEQRGAARRLSLRMFEFARKEGLDP